MFVVEATEHIDATDDVSAFVIDLDRYRQADHKILRIRSTRQEDDDVVVMSER
jgi:hypothetical protein